MRVVGPEISVIMPVYNRDKILAKAVQSVLSQTFENFELVIVDDCSTDNSIAMLKNFNDPRIKIYQLKKNSGASVARNYGIKMSYGHFISFLDSDDFYDKDFLYESLKLLKNTSGNIGFSWTGRRIWENGKCKEEVWEPKIKDTTYLTFLEDLRIGTGAGIMVKSEVFQRCGVFNESLNAAEDTEFFLRITQFYDYRFTRDILINIVKGSNDRMSKNFTNIGKAYNIFLPDHIAEINKSPFLMQKFFYKMMWLNYHLLNKRQARSYFKMIPLKNLKTFFKVVGTKLIYEIFPLYWAKSLHLKFYNFK